MAYFARKVSDALDEMATYLDKDMLFDAILSMGPGCIFDDFKSPEEEAGAMRILDWIRTQHKGTHNG